ncbi:hypothetical protein [Saccharothrix sp. Mg75]|uniref:hypothetical protein n=1 Tax=Saccharothrix sp. Mg75 TaxID=3445357 RepID=UPI003EEDD5E3
MSGPERPTSYNTIPGTVHGNVVQGASVGDVHFHYPVPTHRDPSLALAGGVVVVAGLGLLAPLVLLGALLLSSGLNPKSTLRSLFGGVLPLWGNIVVLLVVGYLAVNLLHTGWDLVGRRHQAWRRDSFAGQSSLWLSLLVPVLALAGAFDWADEISVALVVVVAGAGAAALVAAARACTGGAGRRPGLAVAAGAGAALWFGPELWVLWALSGAPLPWRVAGTLALSCGVAVPVLAVVAVPAVRGAAVLRGWAFGIVLVSALGLAMSDWISSEVSPLPLFASPVGAVLMVLVVSSLLTKGAKRAVDGPGSAADPG